MDDLMEESVDIEFYRKTELLLKVVVPMNHFSKNTIENYVEDDTDSFISGLVKITSHIINSKMPLEVGDEVRCEDFRFIITPEFMDDLIETEKEVTAKYIANHDIKWN